MEATPESKEEKSSCWVAPRVHTEADVKNALAQIPGNPNLPPVPYPALPVFTREVSIRKRLVAYQKFISSFEYNYTGQNYFLLRRDRGFAHLMSMAKEIMNEALPIQCIEAVFLGVYLTCGLSELIRIPVSFKSRVNGRAYKHIILALRYKDKWGALGLSRKSSLMYKDCKFPSFSALMWEYKSAYEECQHTLAKLYIGLPFTHDKFSQNKIKWRAVKVDVSYFDWEVVSAFLEDYISNAARLFTMFQNTGKLPGHPDYVVELVRDSHRAKDPPFRPLSSLLGPLSPSGKVKSRPSPWLGSARAGAAREAKPKRSKEK